MTSFALYQPTFLTTKYYYEIMNQKDYEYYVTEILRNVEAKNIKTFQLWKKNDVTERLKNILLWISSIYWVRIIW